jgi:hypothetical protein
MQGSWAHWLWPVGNMYSHIPLCASLLTFCQPSPLTHTTTVQHVKST